MIRDSWGKSTALRSRDENWDETGPSQRAFTLPETEMKKARRLEKRQRKSEIKETQGLTPKNEPNVGISNTEETSGLHSQGRVKLLSDYLEWIQSLHELELFNEQEKVPEGLKIFEILKKFSEFHSYGPF